MMIDANDDWAAFGRAAFAACAYLDRAVPACGMDNAERIRFSADQIVWLRKRNEVLEARCKEWAEKYNAAMALAEMEKKTKIERGEMVVELRTALEFYATPENYRLNGYPDGDRPIWTDYGAKARAALGYSPNGPHYVLVGYNGNRTPCAAITVYAASAGLDVVRENAVGMLHDAGSPQVKTADAIASPNIEVAR